jgi:hypothetical protein
MQRRRPFLRVHHPQLLAGVLLGLALGLGVGRVVTLAAGAAVPSPRDRPGADPGEAAPTPAALTVHGLVIDATTQRAIPRFRVIPGALMSHGVTWQPHLITTHKGGQFHLPPNERAWDQTQFRVEAEGYRPGISRIVKKSEGEVKLRFALQADPGISAVVRTPEGAPAAGAQAIWATLSHEATGHGATISLSNLAEPLGARVVTADAAGRFRLPPESDPGVVLVAHERGYAEIQPADLARSGVVTLHRWCRVEGRVLAGTKPVAGQKVWIYRIGSPGEASPTHSWEDEAITGADGQFACDRVVQGRLVVDRVFAARPVQGIVHGLATTIEIREGQVTQVSLGGPGRALIGRFEASKDLGLPIDWSKVGVQLGLKAPHIGFPGDEPIWETYRAFLNTEEGRAYLRDHLPVARDGSFRIEAVPPGDYLLSVWVFGPAIGKPAETDTLYATAGARIEVKATASGRDDEPQALGTILLRTQTR